ncbi:MAG TPA: TPM domain-containing protein [Nitrospirales bacterium]|nr:TPM domain-containing protein [Nitrospirales bacterium]
MPPLTGRIVDHADLLSAELESALTTELAEHERRTGNQIAILTVRSLAGEPLEEYSHRVASAWQLGRKGTDNGVLILVVPDDRRARIEVGYGLEGALTDAKSSRILRNVMIPRFKDGDYAGGIAAGARAVMGTIEGTYQAPDEPPVGPAGAASGFLFAVAVGVLIGTVFAAFMRVLGGLVGGAIAFAMMIAAGVAVAAAAGLLGMIGAMVLSAWLESTRGSRALSGPWMGSGGWPSGRWSSSDDGFFGGGGSFGGGGASGRW